MTWSRAAIEASIIARRLHAKGRQVTKAARPLYAQAKEQWSYDTWHSTDPADHGRAKPAYRKHLANAMKSMRKTGSTNSILSASTLVKSVAHSTWQRNLERRYNKRENYVNKQTPGIYRKK